MEEIEQKTSELSVMYVIRLLWSKVLLLLLVLIVGGVLGAALGWFRTHDVQYYGTTLEFYINPRKDSDDTIVSDSQYGAYGSYNVTVMNTIVELLSSEAFAEKLMLDENGFPKAKNPVELPNGEYSTRIEELNNAALYLAKQETIDAQAEYDAFIANDLAVLKADLATATETLNEAWAAARDSDPGMPEKPQWSDNTELNALITAKERAQIAYDTGIIEAKALLNEADAAQEQMLEIWRNVDKDYYTSKLNKIVNSVQFSYYNTNSGEEVNKDDLARSFIYVKISVLNDKAYAQNLRELLIDQIPDYIVEKMPVPSGYDGTSCIRTSRTDDVAQTNTGVVTSTAIKYALIFGAAALAIAAVVIVVIDRSDKRLRSVEQITDSFNVPVLGVIPTFKDTQRVDATSESTQNPNTDTEVNA